MPPRRILTRSRAKLIDHLRIQPRRVLILRDMQLERFLLRKTNKPQRRQTLPGLIPITAAIVAQAGAATNSRSSSLVESPRANNSPPSAAIQSPPTPQSSLAVPRTPSPAALMRTTSVPIGARGRRRLSYGGPSTATKIILARINTIDLAPNHSPNRQTLAMDFNDITVGSLHYSDSE